MFEMSFNSFFERIINENIFSFDTVGSGFKIRTMNGVKCLLNNSVGAKYE